jgi:hypothetical protein
MEEAARRQESGFGKIEKVIQSIVEGLSRPSSQEKESVSSI